jgi:hypothetical protein
VGKGEKNPRGRCPSAEAAGKERSRFQAPNRENTRGRLAGHAKEEERIHRVFAGGIQDEEKRSQRKAAGGARDDPSEAATTAEKEVVVFRPAGV